MSPWRAKARSVIERALKEGGEMGLEGRSLVKYIDMQYPFDVRKNHPYQIWLNERSLLVFGHGKPMSKAKAKKPRDAAGQGELFGGTEKGGTS